MTLSINNQITSGPSRVIFCSRWLASDFMHAKYDDETVRITPRFRKALEELMAAECEMMAKNDPKYADCWTWGHCEIADLCRMDGLRFTFGGDDCERSSRKRFSVTVANASHEPRR